MRPSRVLLSILVLGFCPGIGLLPCASGLCRAQFYEVLPTSYMYSSSYLWPTSYYGSSYYTTGYYPTAYWPSYYASAYYSPTYYSTGYYPSY